jgi:hypothetical protein
MLESRALLSTFVVRSAADAGPGTLRQAILVVNSKLGVDRIVFDIPHAPGSFLPPAITPMSPLPTITAPVTIDGYTQPGARPNRLAAGDDAIIAIDLDGRLAGPLANGLSISSGGTTVRGLAIGNFGGDGVALSSGAGNLIQGNFIGLSPSGVGSAPNAGNGVDIGLGSRGDVIGGATPAARNVISMNGHYGVYIGGSKREPTLANTVLGNFIGTDRTGRVLATNVNVGVVIQGSSFNTIGGTVRTDGNFIVDAAVDDVHILPGDPRSPGGPGDTLDNVVVGNFLNTDVTGASQLGSAANGICVKQATGTQVVRNVIAGTQGYGIILLAGADGGLIRGNLIGSDASRSRPLGNGQGGILLHDSVTGNTIGGPGSGQSNFIAYNGGPGVVAPSGTKNRFLFNRFLSNKGPNVAFNGSS